MCSSSPKQRSGPAATAPPLAVVHPRDDQPSLRLWLAMLEAMQLKIFGCKKSAAAHATGLSFILTNDT